MSIPLYGFVGITKIIMLNVFIYTKHIAISILRGMKFFTKTLDKLVYIC